MKSVQGQRLTIVAPVKVPGRRGMVKARCACGNEIIVKAASVRDGNTRSCGCLRLEVRRAQKPHRRKHAAIDQRYHRLVVIADARPNRGSHERRVKCRCDCGEEVTVRVMDLVHGHTRGCGCGKKLRWKNRKADTMQAAESPTSPVAD